MWIVIADEFSRIEKLLDPKKTVDSDFDHFYQVK